LHGSSPEKGIVTTLHEFDGPEWWRRAAIYQIFPSSFQDSNGDGWGDLPGILARLPYLASLGIDAVWLSPIHPSPMLDGGYDVEDFTGVNPLFGTLADFDRLLEAMRSRNIKLILDFVPNHSSDRHPWFVESRASRSSPQRDWYVWSEPGRGNNPPNNWLSRFGGSAWELDACTGAYYYHAFLKEQPDLNWRNPALRAAMEETLRFWMRRGVAGFRVDASGVLVEDALLRDEPLNLQAGPDTPPPERLKRVFTDSRPESFDCLAGLRRVIDEFPERLLAGEADTTTDRLARFYGERDKPRLHLPLNFCLIDSAWSATSVEAAVDAYLNMLPPGACPSWALGGHDKKRVAERIGEAQARVAAMLHMALPGVVVFYAGDEIGLPSMQVPPDRVRDPFAKLVPGYGLGRDPERTPMRWTAEPKAGFTTGEPWLPIGAGIGRLNVASQEADSRSMLALYRRLIALRKSHPGLQGSLYEPLRGAGDIMGFRRPSSKGGAVVALLNLGHAAGELELAAAGRVLLSTHLDRSGEPASGSVSLRADEGLLLELE